MEALDALEISKDFDVRHNFLSYKLVLWHIDPLSSMSMELTGWATAVNLMSWPSGKFYNILVPTFVYPN